MTEQTDQRCVVAAIDHSQLSNAVADYAAWISQRVGVPLLLQHNIEQREPVAASDWSGFLGMGGQEKLLSELTEVERRHSKLMRQKGKLLLEANAERLAERHANPMISQRHGALAETVVEQEDDIRILVIGISGEDHDPDSGAATQQKPKDKLGSQVETIVRSLHQPILVVNQAFSEPQRIMLAYNGSEEAYKALDWMCSSPLYQGLDVHLVHVAERSGKAGSAADLIAEAEQRLSAAGLKVTVAQLSGKPVEVLAGYQAEHGIDLTVMGAFGHSRIHDLLVGSFTAKMLRATQKPVLLLR